MAASAEGRTTVLLRTLQRTAEALLPADPRPPVAAPAPSPRGQPADAAAGSGHEAAGVAAIGTTSGPAALAPAAASAPHEGEGAVLRAGAAAPRAGEGSLAPPPEGTSLTDGAGRSGQGAAQIPAAETLPPHPSAEPPGPQAEPSPIPPSARSTPATDPAPERAEARAPGAEGLQAPITGTSGPILRRADGPSQSGGGGGDDGTTGRFHRRSEPENHGALLRRSQRALQGNLVLVMGLTFATNLLILAIPIYLFQISDRVLTSRSVDTLLMLTIVIVGAVILQAVLDAIRRFILMRSAVGLVVGLGAPVLSAAAHASLGGSGKEYQTLGDLQQLRGFLVSGTLLAFLDVPFAPLFVLMIFWVHPDLGWIVMVTAASLAVVAFVNQKVTSAPFAFATAAQSRANLHLDSMSRNSQVINAMAMIPEAVAIWGRDTAQSLIGQIRAQDRNILSAAVSRAIRLLAQVIMLGWGAWLALQGEITGGMVIASSIIAGRALTPIEGAIEGWHVFSLSRAAYGRVEKLLLNSRAQFERLVLPRPQGRLDVERLLYVPGGTKHVVLNGISFTLQPGDTLAVIGNSGAGKTTLGKMLVGSILPTSGNVRLDLMDLRNWDPRQLGENIGYLPQDVQLFPGTIKENIARMRSDASDAQIWQAAVLADVHDMIASLPQGYETMVAADGAPLSGGQKQRIALARAFFGNPTFLVLDEPNSNLDVAGDAALARAVEHARREKITMVVITQKPALLNSVDKIMLLNQGNIALFGERSQVLAKLSGQAAPQAPALRQEG
ncbi:type I secretion system permease/ATPase [Falsigemmobacter faecalis]|uniref:Type I secretion system permease/ATPase n=1 Tax=Falsigemmobacter faecalis TaxID=2488730 RepID=A0A3P3D432_9RHOB|nr:type I secretion system permease/ATPase [Falsigemmobacter faecalis]RRH68861.1 type I secretion system permease/ATPase [Falsigemmobacter faecalis]